MRTSGRNELTLTLRLGKKYSKTKTRLKSWNVTLRNKSAFMMIAMNESTTRWLMFKMQARVSERDYADSMMKSFLLRNENSKRKCTLTTRGTRSCYI